MVSGETAAEVIYHRVDVEKEFMGLMSFKGDQPTLGEAKIAKNYLNEKNYKQWDRLYLDTLILQKDRQNAPKHGIIGHFERRKIYDLSAFRVPRQYTGNSLKSSK